MKRTYPPTTINIASAYKTLNSSPETRRQPKRPGGLRRKLMQRLA
jgi:hypothetical protein